LISCFTNPFLIRDFKNSNPQGFKKKAKVRVTFWRSGYKQRNISPKHKKSQQMKKLFIVLAVASLGFVACNNDGETKEGTDSTTVKTDSTTIVTPPVVDSLPKSDTTMPKDSVK
jgi:hypothetical protein